MNLAIEIPDPKFTVGDRLLIDRKYPGVIQAAEYTTDIYVHIDNSGQSSRILVGGWYYKALYFAPGDKIDTITGWFPELDFTLESE